MPRKWKDVELALLGTQRDVDIANLIGRTLDEVYTKRTQLGIRECFRPNRLQIRYSKQIYSRYQVEQHSHLLGTMPDKAVAQLLSVTVHSVAECRHKMNIPRYMAPSYVSLTQCVVCGVGIVRLQYAIDYPVCDSLVCRQQWSRRQKRISRKFRGCIQLRNATSVLEKMYEQSCNG